MAVEGDGDYGGMTVAGRTVTRMAMMERILTGGMATPIWKWPARLSGSAPVSGAAVFGSVNGSVTHQTVRFSVRCWKRCGSGPFAALGVTALMIVLTPLFGVALLVDSLRAVASWVGS